MKGYKDVSQETCGSLEYLFLEMKGVPSSLPSQRPVSWLRLVDAVSDSKSSHESLSFPANIVNYEKMDKSEHLEVTSFVNSIFCQTYAAWRLAVIVDNLRSMTASCDCR